MDFKNFYEGMDKTPTYGDHSQQRTEETKLIFTLQTSTAKLPNEFTANADAKLSNVLTSQFTLQKPNDSRTREHPLMASIDSSLNNCPYEYNDTEDSFDRYQREAEELYARKLKVEFKDIKSTTIDDAATCKPSSQVRDRTPEKPNGILHLLSSLTGLTPEGMAHLMETQERISQTLPSDRPSRLTSQPH